MAFHDNADSLFAELQDICDKVLEDYVAPIATTILKSHIRTDIYDAYTVKPNGWVSKDPNGNLVSSTYQRRYSLLREGEGGLFHRLENPGELLISSGAKKMPSVYRSKRYASRDGDFLLLLSSHDMGAWAGGFSRPAVNNAQLEISRSSDVRNAIDSGLRHYTL